ncbi:DUF1727 domain-containing protein [Aerococcus sanguinicola]|uniref:Lipid II isoglutaminyl synthase (glutamine-hydrolyzing) subunit MurT n=1 Tax=Aerococcus sanguinicola TaxID=119206 RepID=A0A2I1MSJ0_9LACT|nr:Mur ligase family protein [Aerococcus sanguinicola]PKZ23071.1 DUF1727 domain-containing protein [Aerococcus sanguinicola]
MRLKTQLAALAGRASYWGLHTFTKGGSSLPGKIAKKVDPDVLQELAKDYRIVLITGTNGKTVTTALAVNILKQVYPHVLTNPTGSNMIQGITSTFVSQASTKSGQDKIAILEVDEASLRHVTAQVTPELIVATNIFRDQMDRYGEIYTTYDLILEGAAKTPQARLLLNGDAPIFSSKETANERAYFGFANVNKDEDFLAHYNTDGVICPQCEHILHYHMITYSNLGDFFCPNCGFQRPELQHAVTAIHDLTPDQASFAIDGEDYTIPVAGLYNVYNALAAYSVAKHFGLNHLTIKRGLASAQRIFGRQETIQIEGKEVRINLIKNPVGLNQIIELIKLEKDDFDLITILNDQPADGQDISWIWDGNFEDLAQVDKVQDTAYAGMRAADLKQRLVVAGFDKDQLDPVEDAVSLIKYIKESQSQKVYILATYTAMLELRRALAAEGYVKERMQA